MFALACTGSDKSEPTKPTPTHLEIMAAPAGDDVAKLVREAQIAASKDGRKLLVYVSATWCEPCRYFQEAAERGIFNAEFGSLRLLKFDYDSDLRRLESAGYGSEMIPLWVVPEPSGRGSDKRMAGSVKGPEAVGDIRPRLRKLVDAVVW